MRKVKESDLVGKTITKLDSESFKFSLKELTFVNAIMFPQDFERLFAKHAPPEFKDEAFSYMLTYKRHNNLLEFISEYCRQDDWLVTTISKMIDELVTNKNVRTKTFEAGKDYSMVASKKTEEIKTLPLINEGENMAQYLKKIMLEKKNNNDIKSQKEGENQYNKCVLEILNLIENDQIDYGFFSITYRKPLNSFAIKMLKDQGFKVRNEGDGIADIFSISWK